MKIHMAVLMASCIFSTAASAQLLKRAELKSLHDQLSFNAEKKCIDPKRKKAAEEILQRVDENAMGEFTSEEVRRLKKARAYMNKGNIRALASGSDCAKDYKRAADEVNKVIETPQTPAAAPDPGANGPGASGTEK